MATIEEFDLFPALTCGFAGTWIASQWPHELHLLSHLGGLEPICALTIALFSLAVYPNLHPKKKTKQKKVHQMLNESYTRQKGKKKLMESEWKGKLFQFSPAGKRQYVWKLLCLQKKN